MEDLKRYFSLGHLADHVRGVTLKGGAGDGRKLIRTDDGGHIAKEVVPSGVWTTVEETAALKAELESRITMEASRLEARMDGIAAELDLKIERTADILDERITETEASIRADMVTKEWAEGALAPKLVEVGCGGSNDESGESGGGESMELADLAVGNYCTIHDHMEDHENPHFVTKEQVGLGNVDNTSDMDKPVSTATMTEIERISKALLNDPNPTIGEIAAALGWIEDSNN